MPVGNSIAAGTVLEPQMSSGLASFQAVTVCLLAHAGMMCAIKRQLRPDNRIPYTPVRAADVPTIEICYHSQLCS